MGGEEFGGVFSNAGCGSVTDTVVVCFEFFFFVTNHSRHNQRMASQWLQAVCVCVPVTFIFIIKDYLISICLLCFRLAVGI